MYASYFGLKELPFRECMACDDLFPSRAMREVHDSIVRALADTSKIVVLSGSRGVGKSTLLKSVGATLGQSYRVLALRRGCASSWNAEHRPDSRASARSASEQDDWVTRCLALLRRRRGCRPVLLVIDDADSLSAGCLSDLLASAGASADDPPGRSLLLVGETEHMFSSDARQPDDTDASSVEFARLDGLSADEVGEYIEHCLTKAGHTGEALFTAGAIGAVKRYTHGIPRLVNNLCGAALVVAADSGERRVTVRSIEEAADDLSFSLSEQEHVAIRPLEHHHLDHLSNASPGEFEQDSHEKRPGARGPFGDDADTGTWWKGFGDWTSRLTPWREQLDGLVDVPAIAQQGRRYAAGGASMVGAAGRKLVAEWHRWRARDGSNKPLSRQRRSSRPRSDDHDDSPRWSRLQIGFGALLTVLALGFWVMSIGHKASDSQATNDIANDELPVDRRDRLEVGLQAVLAKQESMEAMLARLVAKRDEPSRQYRESKLLTSELRNVLYALNAEVGEVRKERAALATSWGKISQEREPMSNGPRAVQVLLFDQTHFDRTTPRLDAAQPRAAGNVSKETSVETQVGTTADARGKLVHDRGESPTVSQSNTDALNTLAKVEAADTQAPASAMTSEGTSKGLPDKYRTDSAAAAIETEQGHTDGSSAERGKPSAVADGGRPDKTEVEATAGSDQESFARVTEVKTPTPNPKVTAPATLTPVAHTSVGKQITHEVVHGDSLWAIARRHNVTIDDLRRWNSLPTGKVLRPGVTLVVGGTDRTTGELSGDWKWYVVRPGDTLGGISRRLGISSKDIRRWNDIGEQVGLVVGQRLRLKAADKDTSSEERMLTEVAGLGDDTAAGLVLEADADPNARDASGYTALMRSASRGEVRVSRVILAAGGDPDLRNEFGETATMLAAWEGQEQIVALLLEANADPNIPNSDGWTALVYASVKGQVDVVRILLDAGAEVNTSGKDGRTPLLAASWNGHSAVVEQLLAAGADVNHRDQGGLSPLAGASANGHTTIVELLQLHGARAEDLAKR